MCNPNFEILKVKLHMNLIKETKIEIYPNIYSLTSSYNPHVQSPHTENTVKSDGCFTDENPKNPSAAELLFKES